MELQLFRGFSFGENQVEVSHLQFADDTLILGDASISNVQTLKAIFRCFELVSGLKVNFHKSSLMGLNVEEDFMVTAADYLNCKLGSFSFMYLGLPVGGKP